MIDKIKFQKKEKNEFAEQYEDVGYRLYLILARMLDVDSRLLETRKSLFYDSKIVGKRP